MKHVRSILGFSLLWLPLFLSAQMIPFTGTAVEMPIEEIGGLQTGKLPKPDLKKMPVWRMPSAKAAVFNSLDEMSGFYVQRNYDMNGGTRSPGITINPIKDKPSAITIDNFGGLGKSIEATVDLVSNKISIAPQVVTTNNGTDLYLYAFNPETGIIDTKGVLEGIIDKDGITLGAWGCFAKNPTSYLKLYYASRLLPSNATMVSKIHDSKSEEECQVYVEQEYDNTLKILNLCNTGAEVIVNLHSDKTFAIPAQPIVSSSEYGVFYCYWTDWAQGVYSPELPIVGTGTNKSLKTGNWAIISVGGRAFIEKYTSSTITLTKENMELRYPQILETNFEGEGTKASPYLIKTVDNLLALEQSVNLVDESKSSLKYKGKFFRLENDLDMKGISSQMLPIGSSPYFCRFAGTFDGNGRKISNIKMESANFDYIGLFGVIDSAGSVKNLTVENIDYKITGDYVGGIAGLSFGAISQCSVTGKINAKGEKIGGVVGELRNEISGCSFEGNLTALGSVGGIAALSFGGVDKCWSRVDILCSYAPVSRYMGGVVGIIFGNNGAKINDCYSSGVIVDIVDQLKDNLSIAYQAGVSGVLFKSEMNRCFSSVRVLGTAASALTGGVIGMLTNGKVLDCYNAGDVFNPYSDATGGVIGKSIANENAVPSIIKNVYNSGNVSTKATTEYKDVIAGLWPVDIFENYYFDSRYYNTVIPKGGLTALQMTRPDQMKGFDTNIWNFSDGQYPCLKGIDQNDAAYLSAAALIFADNEFPAKVKTALNIKTDNGIAWKALKNEKYVANGYGISIEGNQVKLKTIFATDTLYVFNAKNEFKNYQLSIYPKVFDGDGTVASPSLIKTLDDLKTLAKATIDNMQHFEGEHFLMANDIDVANDKIFAGIASSGNPVHYFAGTFDGGNHTIHNFTLEAVTYLANGRADDKTSLSGTGFIGYLSPTGVLKNLTIAKDCTFDLWAFAAPLVGYNGGTIENCRNYADVKGISSYIGGITGYSENAKARISNCFNTGNITCGLGYVGGIVGTNIGIVENSQNNGDVLNKEINAIYAAKKQSDAGGIVGSNLGELRDVLNIGDVTSYLNVGGIAGSNDARPTGKANIVRSVNYGYVNPLVDISSWGSIIGNLVSSGELKDNYFDLQILLAEGAKDAKTVGCNGINTSELTSGTLANLDKENIWVLNAGAYPLLKKFKDEPKSIAASQMFVKFTDGENRMSVKTNAALNQNSNLSWKLKVAEQFKNEGEVLSLTLPENDLVFDTLTATYGDYHKDFYLRAVPPVLAGKGTKEEPWLVNTPADMEKIAKFSEGKVDFNHEYFRVEKDIDFTGVEYKPIAANVDILKFKGYFDGNGKKFTNITYSSPQPLVFGTGRFKGLFGVVGSNGTIANLTIENSSFLAFSYVGAFAGALYGSIVNCVNKAEVSTVGGANSAGGLVGQAFAGGIISNSSNYGSVTSNTGTTGGIAGTADAGTLIENSSNSGTIFAAGPNAGKNAGIVGDCGGDVKSCTNEGEIKGNDTNIAGIAATIKANSSITDCINKGKVTGLKASVAGISSYVGTNTTVRNCVNKGEISGTGTVSGIVGTSEDGTFIEQCHNEGKVTASTTFYAGGVVASLKAGTILQDCWNLGAISAKGSAGGVVGTTSGNKAKTTIVRRVYNEGDVTSIASDAGGVIGKIGANVVVDSCYNIGDVYAEVDNAGGITASNGDSLANCWNAGNITAKNSHSAGIAALGLGQITNCCNFGNVTVSGTTDKNINAAGIIAKTRGILTNCYNMGNVTAFNQAGGLYGQIFNNGAKAEAYQCYNAGKVTVTGADSQDVGNIVGLNPDFLISDEVYFDKNVSAAEYPNDNVATAKTTKEMTELELGDNWISATATYPTLKSLGTHDAINLYAATVLLKEGDTFDNVTDDFLVGTPAGVTWLASGHVTITGNNAVVESESQTTVALTATAGDFKKEYSLKLNTKGVGIEQETVNKIIVKRSYYTTNGLQVEQPVEGVNIVVTVYDDGTTENSKILVEPEK